MEKELQTITIYRGNLAGGNAGNHYYRDAERARMYTIDGKDEEISSMTIDTSKIYKKKPLPFSFGHGEGLISYVEGQETYNAIHNLWENTEEAAKAGYDAFWTNEGVNQPNAIFVVNKERFEEK